MAMDDCCEKQPTLTATSRAFQDYGCDIDTDEVRACINCEFFEVNKCRYEPPFALVEQTDWCRNFRLPFRLADRIREAHREAIQLASRQFLAGVKQDGFE